MENPASQGTAGCKPLTTFVQTDTNTFREVVQRLTGPSESDVSTQERAAMKIAGIKRQTSKLHERRQYTRPKLEIVKPPIIFKPGSSPSKPEAPSFPTSPVGTPSTIFSKLSIMEEQNKEETAVSELNSQEEEKAIKERRFYLHPSPRSTPGYTEPELLTLFPLSSPRTKKET
ncbi:putative VQ motif-containing protein [Melia azedarach]|uniref:VQ motif-containing protein n=2 Tax=Melia azedarach TaxID=155640 RepID=A0ACC1XUJ9_MELAZ|nr:putative VQ motif-containing protein [Melia azedarach]KAJ4715106.1 putative VQ motif-containing protein [Melia azedarach]